MKVSFTSKVKDDDDLQSLVSIAQKIKGNIIDYDNIDDIFTMFFDFLFKNRVNPEMLVLFIQNLYNNLVNENNLLEGEKEDYGNEDCELDNCNDCEYLEICSRSDTLLNRGNDSGVKINDDNISIHSLDRLKDKYREVSKVDKKLMIEELINSPKYITDFKSKLDNDADFLESVVRNYLHHLFNNTLVN